MTKKVISIATASDDARMWGAEMMLLEALHEVRIGARSSKKAMILWLDDDNDDYKVGFTQCGMTLYECILLAEIGKDRLKQEQSGYGDES